MKNPLFKTYNGLVKQLWGKFSQIQSTQISREENAKANKFSQLDLSDPKATMGILVEVFNQPSTSKEQNVMAIDAHD